MDTIKKPRKANADVRNKARESGVFLWQIALEIGVSEPTLVKWLRVELEPERKAQIVEAIEKLTEH